MISVVIIAKNEEEIISTCLESVKWADEVVVVLNDSTDGTEKVAKKYTDNIIKIKGQDFARVRNLAMEKVKGDWVLYVDADERVLEPLKNEIMEKVGQDNFSAMAISRKNIIFGREVSYGPYKKDWVIRLFKKSDFESWVGKVHEYGKFNGQLIYSKNSFLHLTHRDVNHFVTKALEWADIDASLRLEDNHPKMVKWRFIRILFSEMWNQGIKRKGFFDGDIGVIDCLLQVFSMYLTYVKLWQLQQPKSLTEVYKEIDQKLVKDNFKF